MSEGPQRVGARRDGPQLDGPQLEGARRERLVSIDLVRGLVMVLMALDHLRDFFGDFRVDPQDMQVTTPALFLTRWLTHFCAPTFVFLAGTAAFLYGARPGRSRRDLAWFLASRGLWLVVLEVTLVSAGWWLELALVLSVLQVIAAIGAGMVVLAGLIWLPRRVLLVLALAIVCGHSLLDGVVPADLAAAPWLWTLLHEGPAGPPLFLAGEYVPQVLQGHMVIVQYPLLPWIGVIALGYAAGPLFQLEGARRRRSLLGLGLGVTALFGLLRWTNLYGDPTPWAAQGGALMTLVSFCNLEKYPPSSLFLAMTLGPMLMLLALCERARGPLARALLTFGRVPLFYYLLHLYVINLSAGLLYWIRDGEFISPLAHFFQRFGQEPPSWFGNDNDLLTVYVAWLVIVAALYLPCRWYMGLKRRGASTLWSYL